MELLPIGSWETCQQGSDVAVLAVGPMAYTAMDAAKNLASIGITCEVVNCRFIVNFLISTKKTTINIKFSCRINCFYMSGSNS